MKTKKMGRPARKYISVQLFLVVPEDAKINDALKSARAFSEGACNDAPFEVSKVKVSKAPSPSVRTASVAKEKPAVKKPRAKKSAGKAKAPRKPRKKAA